MDYQKKIKIFYQNCIFMNFYETKTNLCFAKLNQRNNPTKQRFSKLKQRFATCNSKNQ